jgi:hypothetical protein
MKSFIFNVNWDYKLCHYIYVEIFVFTGFLLFYLEAAKSFFLQTGITCSAMCLSYII